MGSTIVSYCTMMKLPLVAYRLNLPADRLGLAMAIWSEPINGPQTARRAIGGGGTVETLTAAHPNLLSFRSSASGGNPLTRAI